MLVEICCCHQLIAMEKSWVHKTREIRSQVVARTRRYVSLGGRRISSWRPSKLGSFSCDKDAFQTSSHRAVHSVGVWSPCSTVDKHVDELSDALHFVTALFE